MNVSQDEVLTWSSSIEMADRYATYLITGRERFADDKICNCSPNTFGKFCEYEFMTMPTFEDAIQYQFQLKMKYQNGSQLLGNITCYATLTNCYFGLRCLAWQNICDGKQQCMDGIDEDRCEELEYNECEENEYRCEDGSCISEQYWLDGQYDCSDRSDEQVISPNDRRDNFCPLTSSHFNCDEATAHYEYFACGDGQFTHGLPTIEAPTCYNYRSYIIPFLINLLSTIILIILITRKRAIATGKKGDRPRSKANIRFTFRSYIDLWTENKELILAPLVTMFPQLFSLPQFILSFSLACQEFKVNWQCYLLIISYFITYLPQVLSFKLYISPSTFYTNEFRATKLNKKINTWWKLLISK